VTSVSPASGVVAGGVSVTITGAGFSGATAVTFGSTNAISFTVNSSTQITATAPAGAGIVDVTVTIPGGGTSATSTADHFTYVGPIVTGVSPGIGPTPGGTSVTITGAGFTGATAVKFGAIDATAFTVLSDTQITAISPPGGGSVDITVTTPVFTSLTSNEDQFRYYSFLVTNTSSSASTSGSLPWAVAQADAAASNAYITFDSADFPTAVTITLSSALNLTNSAHSITIDGSGAGPIAISSSSGNRIFAITSGSVLLKSLAIINGNNEYGSSVYVTAASLTISNCTLSGNSCGYGGAAIDNDTGGTLTVIGSTFTSNSGNNGSTIVSNTAMTIENCTFTGNSGGSVIACTGGSMVVSNCSMNGNYASALSSEGNTIVNNTTISNEHGAGGVSEGGNGFLTLNGCTITGTNGGTVFGSQGSEVNIDNCTISGNTGSSSFGGNNSIVTTYGSFLNVVNSTISGNNGIGIWNYANASLLNTIVAGNTASADVVGTFFANDSMIGNAFGATITGTGNVINPTNLGLGTLSNNGGSTQTVPLLSGSPAIGAGGAVTTISAAVANTTTTITLANLSVLAASPLPSLSSGWYFTIQIDGEQMAVTGVTSLGLTVVRGFNGTTAATHSSGAPVYLVSDQRGYVIPSNIPPVVDIGAYQSTGAAFPLTVASISPNTGGTAGGTRVIITGAGFTGATTVFFGNSPAIAFTVNSPSQITAISPAGAGVVDVTVTVPGAGTSVPTSADQFTYVAAPTVTGLNPTAGPVSGGTSVTITGTGFMGATAVQFGSTIASTFTVVSSTQITAIDQAGSSTVDVTVTVPVGGKSVTTSADQFTYVAAPTVTGLNPTAGPVSGGTSVIITGYDFTGATAVKFGAINATTYTVNSSTQITAISPAGGVGVVDVTVTIPEGGTSATSAADRFTYVGLVVTGVNPSVGPAVGGTSVTITGTGFTGATAVKFGATNAAAYTVISDTQIAARSPAGSGIVNVTVATPAFGTSATSSADQFTYGWLVTNTSNSASTTGSLPWAVAQANAATNNAYINFSSTAFPSATTITLAATLTLSNTAHSITIDGSGAGPITINGNALNAFQVNAGVNSAFKALKISGASGSKGIVATGTVSLNNCTISGHSTGVQVPGGGMLTATDSAFTNNSGPSEGGIDSEGQILLSDCTLSNNSPAIISGLNQTGQATLEGCTFANNQGGIYNGSSASMSICDCTFNGNSVTGAIINAATMTICDSTISGNSASVGSRAGGISNSGTLSLSDTIVAGNTANGANWDISGSNVTGSFNLIGAGAPGLTNGVNGNQVGTPSNPINPLLNPLGNNGGPTKTMSEQTGSPAIGTGGAVTTLGANVSDTTSTSITIPNHAIFAAQALPVLSLGLYFIIQVDGEQMAVTGLTLSSGTTATLTVVRGVNGTTAATHSSGASIYLVFDQRGYVLPLNNPPVVDIGAYQSTGSTLLPTVASISPNSGGTAGGTTVVITGTNFTNATAVKFGANNAATFTISSDTQITAIDPAGTGAVDVTVASAAGTSATSSADQFTYVAPPTVTGLGPNSGPVAGGTSVVITGTGFTGASSVFFGNSPATGFAVNSPTQITATSPAGAGVVDVTVAAVGGTSTTSSADQFTYVGAAITGVSPNDGPDAGGTIVTITGTGFTGATAVMFGANNATTFNVDSDTQITATSPAGVGVVDVSVTTPVGGTSADSAADQFTYVAVPTVTGISPTTGPATGGANVIISGTGFTGATTIMFGATNAANFTVNSATQITATAPAGLGVVDVTVTTPIGGASPTSAFDQFTYVAAPTVTGVSPNSGLVSGGATVTITGTGFTGATAVEFGSTNATSFTVNSDTQITALSPAGSGVVDVTVAIPVGGTSIASNADQFPYIGPVVSGLNPNFGPVSGGTVVIITGSGFTGATSVNFGANSAMSFTVNSDTQITATSPTGAGIVDVTVTTSVGGTSVTSNADHFTYGGVWVVTNTSNSWGISGSLPWAVAQADADPINSIITFSPTAFPSAATITLTSILTLSKTSSSITIAGAGAGPISISGGGVTGIFQVNPGVTVTMTGLTLEDGYNDIVYWGPGGVNDGDAGAINNDGSLTVNNCTFSDNTSAPDGGYGDEGGGAIYNSGILAVSNSMFSGNSVDGNGGAISCAGMMTVNNCTFTGNSAKNGGGAIFSVGQMLVDDCTFSGNGFGQGFGGGINNQGAATVMNSTFSGNSASADGAIGNINPNSGTATLIATNCTVADNSAGSGGGIGNSFGNVTLNDCTITGNDTGFATTNTGGMAYLFGNIIAGNATGSGNDDVNGQVSGSYNFIGNGNGMSGISNGSNHNHVGTTANPLNPELGSLANNGGPTQTEFPQSGSPVIGASGSMTQLRAPVSSSSANTITVNSTGLAAANLPSFTAGSYFVIQVGSEQMAVTGLTQLCDYQVGDVLTVTGGTPDPAATLAVTAVSNGFITGVSIINGGYYPNQLPPSQNPVTGGSGSGAIINLTITNNTVTAVSIDSGGTPVGSILNVTRGLYGTTATTYAANTSVYMVIDQRGYTAAANNPPTLDIGAVQTSGGLRLTTVTSVNPNFGNTSGGTTVTITGTNFTGTTAVYFGSTAATSFTVNSNTQITAVDPAEAAGTVDITVTGALGTSAQSASDQFTYNVATTTSVTSNPVGPIAQGTSVTFTAITTGNPNVGVVSFYYDYGAPDQFEIGGAVSVSSGSATSDATTALPVGTDMITAIYSGGVGFEGSQGTLVIQVSAPPNITNVVINQDNAALYNAAGQPFAGAQRSMVDDIVYTFSEPVDIASPIVNPNVFAVAVAAGWAGTVPTLSWAPVGGSGNTQWAVTFSGSSVTGGSIANGAYTITVNDPASITAQSDSQALSLADSGIGSATQSFYRLFGDINGDEIVNAADNARFKQALTTYNPAFDYDQSGFCNACDNAYFKQDLTLNFSGFTTTI
jgi:IPT/TIG domain/Right handed beta helix region